MRNLRLLILFLVMAGFSFSCSNSMTKIEKSKDPDYKLAKANEFYEKKKYRNAQQLYEGLFPIYKGSQRFEELYYKCAYCFFNQKDYQNAESWFKGYLEVFPNSEKAEEISYMRALSYYKQSPKVELEQVNTVKAISMMQEFTTNFPNSARVKDANAIISEARAKLEKKDFNAAVLFYNLGHYRASALAFADLMLKYPETQNAEEYKLKSIRSYYKFAEMSMPDKQAERFEKVVDEYNDFYDRFPESKFLKDAEEYSILSKKKIKEIENEQITQAVKR